VAVYWAFHPGEAAFADSGPPGCFPLLVWTVVSFVFALLAAGWVIACYAELQWTARLVGLAPATLFSLLIAWYFFYFMVVQRVSNWIFMRRLKRTSRRSPPSLLPNPPREPAVGGRGAELPPGQAKKKEKKHRRR
jgi:hypothetical protein